MVNTARGALLDTQAAADAVAQGRLGARCADVFPVEPWPGMAFHHPRVMFTPHAAGFHLGLAQSVREGLQNAVGAFVAGRTVPHLC
jgi:phosphoglycerate dehydrogenase-like enzyme